jgi:hypothetical protein
VPEPRDSPASPSGRRRAQARSGSSISSPTMASSNS